MRQHRVRHQRVLRLRKTDYTAGHLLAAETANRHWTGGDSNDEGFAYSFEEGRSRHRHLPRHRHTQGNRNHTLGGGSARAHSSTSPSTGTSRSVQRSSTAARGNSYSPTRGLNSRSVRNGAGRDRTSDRGTKSAPRLPSLLDVEDMYGGGSILGSPNLEQCLLAVEMSGRNAGAGSGGAGGGGGTGGGGGGGSRASSSRNSAVGSGNYEADSSRSRRSSDGGGIGSSSSSRGGSRNNRRSSLKRIGKDAAGGGGGGSGSGGSSTGGIRGTDTSVDSLSHRKESYMGSGVEESSGFSRGGRFAGGRSKGGGRGGRGEKGAGSSASGETTGDEADLDKIFNPLAFLDEKKGIRVLIQATKPLEVGLIGYKFTNEGTRGGRRGWA